ncbi:MAG: type II toxin-antitoxin system VapC family toxin [Ignavibacteria bacterium]|nr:type II toxin-antitoxin system VapC family toxin [Ignavibacteria bacterium]
MKFTLPKQRIYVDTSVVGGCYDKEFEEWSNKLVDEFIEGTKIVVLSDITLEELEDAPENVRNVIPRIPKENIESVLLDFEGQQLAELYIREGAISRNYEEDALHIATATIHRVNVLVSWNFHHIVNVDRIRIYNAVNLKYGYQLLDIRTPREVLDEK